MCVLISLLRLALSVSEARFNSGSAFQFMLLVACSQHSFFCIGELVIPEV